MELPVTETTAPPKLETIHSASEIQQLIPHRWPILMVDRIVEYDQEAKRIVGIKGVAATEWYFQGHFPGLPVMPGVLQVEALAQTLAIYVAKQPGFGERIGLFAGIDDCRFKRIVVPGDVLRLEITMEKLGGRFGRARGVASVDGEVACEATLSFIIPSEGVLRWPPASRSSRTSTATRRPSTKCERRSARSGRTP
jgi:3-hydroxyacyl-[acyl-carrier-protein] dehydratase